MEPGELRRKPKFQPEEYHDKGWAIVFILNVVLVTGICSYAWYTGAFADLQRGGDAGPIKKAEYDALLRVMGVSLGCAVVFAAVWMVLLQYAPLLVVETAFRGLPFVLVIFAIAAFLFGAVLLGIVLLIFAALMGCYVYYWLWQRRFACAALLEQVSSVFSKHPGIFLVATVALVVMCAWFVVWLFALVGTAVMSGGAALNPGVIILFVLMLFWGFQVGIWVIHMTAAGILSRFYFNEDAPGCVYESAGHACTHYFGSVCFGAFVIALLQTLYATAKFLEEQGREDGNIALQLAGCCCACIISQLEDIFRMYSTYAFNLISVYGVSFGQAGHVVIEMVWTAAGFEALVNNDMTGLVCFFGCFCAGLVNCLAVVFYALSLGLAVNMVVVAAILGFVVGYLICSAASSLVQSGCTALFTCYALDPQACRNNAGMDKFNESMHLKSYS